MSLTAALSTTTTALANATSTTAISMVSMPSSTTFAMDDPSFSRISYLSSTTTSLIACVTPMIGLMYLGVLSWTWQYAHKDPRPLNKISGVRVQKYAPFVYVLLVLSSLTALAFASWLILQYQFNHNYPNIQTRNGVRFLLFVASWTTLTAGTYTLLFVHPTWSKHPVSSIGSQGIWTFITWLFWVVGAGIINGSVPSMLDKGTCEEVVYCAQIRGLFGVAVIQSLSLSASMLVMLWLAWQSARYALEKESFSMH